MLSVVAGKTIHSIAIKKPFSFSFNYFGSICNKSLGVLGVLCTLKSILVASRPKYSVCMVYLHSQRHFKTPLLFLPGVDELKLDIIDPIILLQFFFPCIFHLTNAGW